MLSLNGYANAEYAQSLSEFGTPRRLEQCRGWMLERPIPGSPYFDAMGCYPLFRCVEWPKLHLDIQNLDENLVSLTMIPDPFAEYDEAYLRECFPDLVRPFKSHYVADLQRPINEIVSRHHRKYARKALESIDIVVCTEPENFLDEWLVLHQNLVNKHSIAGISAFSNSAFEKQMRIPGLVVIKALHHDVPVGAQLWFTHGNVAFGHAQAFSDTGYELGASYALYWYSIQYFADKVQWCNYGGIAGVQDDDESELAQFKKGWSTGTRTSYLCGRIINRDRYNQLTATDHTKTDFFPAYRAWA